MLAWGMFMDPCNFLTLRCRHAAEVACRAHGPDDQKSDIRRGVYDDMCAGPLK